jgi:N-methylhydantoinase A
MTTLLGVDVGGTFTDFVLSDEAGHLRIHKRLTTPDDPARAVLEGAAELGLPAAAEVVHGSTIATNALLERRGARTALVATAGFTDVLEIGRQNRPALYALEPQRPPPLVPAALRFGARERVAADGTVLRALDDLAAAEIVEQVAAADVESVAVCLLFAFLRPEHEQRIAAALRARLGPDLFISLSSEILPEYREYERTSTVVINAYVAPLMARYLERLERGLDGRRLRVMQSNGGVIGAAQAGAEAARTALSGPAGGVAGAYHVARLAGCERAITFDMGGTSTDVCLCDGAIPYTSEGEIGGLPLRLPITDLHTVGAGGGSLARVDAGGALRAGPQSAGALPGPACYGRGGSKTTITDANLVLGRLDAGHFLGGRLRLDAGAAHAALGRLAAALGLRADEPAAWGAVQVANAAMERAVRHVSVERGIDPRPFTLVAFGGAGPLHACELAANLGITRVLVPRWPGVLSALGMLVADVVRDAVHAVLEPALALDWFELRRRFAPLEARLAESLRADGIAPTAIALSHALDMRYAGQSYELTVPVVHGADFVTVFHALHGQRYGYAHPDEPVEVVAVRVTASGRTPKPLFEVAPEAGPDPGAARVGRKPVWFEDARGAAPASAKGARALDTTLYTRERLQPGNLVAGPAVVFQLDATTVIPPGWTARVDGHLNLVVDYVAG